MSVHSLVQRGLQRSRKLARGLRRSREAAGTAAGAPYDPRTWWDRRFYTRGVSDRQTLWDGQDPLSAAYHYASVELILLRELRRRRFDPRGASVLDVGSGAGHWIDLYLELGAARVDGVDVSAACVQHLRAKYAARPEVRVDHGLFQEVLAGRAGAYDLVNAIGVLFHVVDDAAWEAGLAAIARALRPGGLLVVGGHFGLLDGVDVQFDGEHGVNKRLRSRRRWCRALHALGFERVRVRANRAHLLIQDELPENNVLVARLRRG